MRNRPKGIATVLLPAAAMLGCGCSQSDPPPPETQILIPEETEQGAEREVSEPILSAEEKPVLVGPPDEGGVPTLDIPEVVPEIRHASLAQGGLAAAMEIVEHEDSWSAKEVPLLLGLLLDETQLLWVDSFGLVIESEKGVPEVTTPAELATHRLVDMQDRLGIDVSGALVEQLISQNLCPDWAAAEVLNRLGESAIPAIRGVLEGDDPSRKPPVLEWFRLYDDELSFGSVEEVVETGPVPEEPLDEEDPFGGELDNSAVGGGGGGSGFTWEEKRNARKWLDKNGDPGMKWDAEEWTARLGAYEEIAVTNSERPTEKAYYYRNIDMTVYVLVQDQEKTVSGLRSGKVKR